MSKPYHYLHATFSYVALSAYRVATVATSINKTKGKQADKKADIRERLLCAKS